MVKTPVHVSLRARVGALHLDLDLATEARLLVLIGPNGAGKTSLLAAILGAVPVERGRIVVGDTVLLDTRAGVDIPIEQRRLGFVPQDFALFPHLTVRQQIALAIGCARPRPDRSTRARRTAASLARWGLTELADRSPAGLSGGERQRVALARALCAEPRALLLDEPLVALDVAARAEVREALGAILADLRIPTIVVTHDPRDACRLGERIAVLEAGRISQVGTWADLSSRPASEFVAAFVRAGAPLPDAQSARLANDP
jgi:molybdate transport system ATP-binding protein